MREKLSVLNWSKFLLKIYWHNYWDLKLKKKFFCLEKKSYDERVLEYKRYDDFNCERGEDGSGAFTIIAGTPRVKRKRRGARETREKREYRLFFTTTISDAITPGVLMTLPPQREHPKAKGLWSWGRRVRTDARPRNPRVNRYRQLSTRPGHPIHFYLSKDFAVHYFSIMLFFYAQQFWI